MSDARPGAPTGGSITIWIGQVQGGDPAALQPLWNAYFKRLVDLARVRLRTGPRGAGDEEDVALSVFNSLWDGIRGGRFPRLDDRDDLWQMLFVITTRKVIGRQRYENRARRDRKKTAPLDDGSASEPGPRIAAAEPTPDEALEVSEQCARLLGLLGSGGLREVAVWKMEGYTNAEIATMLGRSVPTVERKLAAIRTIWKREADR
jgi:DNA-directed RNA polymerase specialized sigma24 family protein